MGCFVRGAVYVVFLALAGCGGDDSGDSGGIGGSSGQSGSGGGNGGSATGGGGVGTGGTAGTGATGNGGAPPGALADPEYREGFGKDATGGEGKATYVVTSSADSGNGSFAGAFDGDTAHDVMIVFDVDTVTLPEGLYVGSNVTIDGTANGKNGVTLDATAVGHGGLVIEDPASNIVIRGINFRSAGAPSSNFPEIDLIALDGTNGGQISDVLVDRCTFVRSSDGALDITGNVSNVTVQRCLFYGSAKTMLVKYDTRTNVSVHHNVFSHNGERNPQVKGDMQLFDFVNNVVHLNDVPAYADGSETSPYGTRIWSCGAGCDSSGEVSANLVGNAYLGAGAQMEVDTGPGGGTNADLFIGDNLCSPSGNCAPTVRATPNTIPSAYVITMLATGELPTALLPFVGAPNRTSEDQQIIDEVAGAFP